MKRHSFHKALDGSSKFGQNLNTKLKLQNLVNDAVNPKNLTKQLDDGTKSFVKTFDHSVGFDRFGNSTKSIIVHTDASGWVKSAYPF